VIDQNVHLRSEISQKHIEIQHNSRPPTLLRMHVCAYPGNRNIWYKLGTNVLKTTIPI
jgi:hypothetical protein